MSEYLGNLQQCLSILTPLDLSKDNNHCPWPEITITP